jgi:hypothetical protein
MSEESYNIIEYHRKLEAQKAPCHFQLIPALAVYAALSSLLQSTGQVLNKSKVLPDQSPYDTVSQGLSDQ